jgi:RNA polymerase sigma-70 factor (ECF subfamily)
VVSFGVIPAAYSQSQTHATLLARLGERGDGTDRGRAWSEFVDRYGELIRGFCRRHGLQASDTDDVLQDVLLSLSKAMPGFAYDPAIGKFRSYLKTVVLHAIYRKLCQARGGAALGDVESIAAGEAITASGDPATDSQWEQEWRQHHLRQAMRAIDAEFSARDRAIFDRYAIGGELAEVVGREMGVTLDALYQIKSRITRRLSQVIEAQVAEEG